MKVRVLFSVLLFAGTVILLLQFYSDNASRLFPWKKFNGRYLFGKTKEGSVGMRRHNTLVSHRINGRSYIPVINNTVYINSATLGNSTSNSSWDLLMLTVWSEDMANVQRCCAFYKNGDVLSITISKKIVDDTFPKVKVKAGLLQCHTPLTSHHELPIAASVVKTGDKCPTNASFYYPLDIVYQQRKGSIGICTKTAYGQINASLLIEWFEIHKFLGIDKVYTQVDPSLNTEARKVFAYYESNDFLITRQFDQPDLVRVDLEQKTKEAYTQGWLNIQDCVEHLQGYTYITVYDFDEFIIPNGNLSWKGMLDDLFSRKPDAAGFRFKTSLIITDFGMTNPNNSMFLTRYLKRSKPYFDRPKFIHRPERIYRGATTHGISSKPGYRKYNCPTDIGFIRHIRKSCRKSKLPNDPCLDVSGRVEDTTIVKFTAAVQNKILSMRHQILGM